MFGWDDLAGIGIGALVKGIGYGAKKKAAKRKQEMESEIARWSPWTKMQPERVEQPSITKDLLSGAGWGLLINDALKSNAPQLTKEDVLSISNQASDQGLNPLYASIYDPTRMA